MKNFLWAMAVVFLILTIVCYSNSVRSVAGLDVANVQMTVFAAACAILCAVNVIGGIVVSEIEDFTNRVSRDPEDKKLRDAPVIEKTDDDYKAEEPSVIIAQPNEVMFCDLCGIRQTKLNRVSIKTRKGPKQKRICDKCMQEKSEMLL